MGKWVNPELAEIERMIKEIRKEQRASEWKALTIIVNVVAVVLVCAAAALLYFLNIKNSGVAEEYIILIAICLAYCVLGTVLNIIRTAFGKKHLALSVIFYILTILVLLGGLVLNQLYLYYHITQNADIVIEISNVALAVYAALELFGISLMFSVSHTINGTGTSDIIDYICNIVISALSALITYFLLGWICSSGIMEGSVDFYIRIHWCVYAALLIVWLIIRFFINLAIYR